jgi:hypothetical protein
MSSLVCGLLKNEWQEVKQALFGGRNEREGEDGKRSENGQSVAHPCMQVEKGNQLTLFQEQERQREVEGQRA